MRTFSVLAGVGAGFVAWPVSAAVIAGPTPVPVDSPWALGGLAVVLVGAAVRIMKNKRK